MSDALHDQLLTIDGSLAGNKKALRRARAKAASKQKKVVQAWELRPSVRHVTLVLFTIACYDASSAAAYLVRVGQRKGWPAKASEELQLMVKDLYCSVGPTEVVALTDPELPSNARAFDEAHRHHEEHCLYEWSLEANMRPGVPVPTRFLVNRMARLRAATGRASPGTVAEPRVRKWAERFRRRWGGRFGTMPVGEVMPLAEMTSKAVKSRFRDELAPQKVITRGQKTALFSSPPGGHRKWTM